MPHSARTGVLIYVKDLQVVSAFYESVLRAKVLHQDEEHKVLQAEDAQLIIHATPAQYAESIVISRPPDAREEQAIKPFFTVSSLATAEQAVVDCGGLVCGPLWPGPGFKVRNVCDPEGNIVQLRVPA